MSRLLLLMVLMLWMAWTPSHGSEPAAARAGDLVLFLGGFGLLVLFMGLWSRRLARGMSPENLRKSLRRFNRVMELARGSIPVWFGVGLFALGWKGTVQAALGPVGREPFEMPSVLVGTLPAFLTWMGLWWSQYPADRALREQNLLIQLDNALPVHAPPGFRSYFSANLRLQLLFMIAPILLILATKDLAALSLRPLLAHVPRGYWSAVENSTMFGATLVVFLFAPLLLRRVLETESLVDPALRSRLDGICKRHGVRYRDVLLWRTQGTMGNAVVMGVLPQVRYVLLSDLLLETMSDEEIEAVFAHELAHILYRHIAWYVVVVVTFMLVMAGPGTSLEGWLDGWLPAWARGDVGAGVLMVLGVVAFVMVFGFISRRFERQADVFAARTVEGAQGHEPVGERGAWILASALRRVAVVNNIPLSGWDWLHGSIASRMKYVRGLAEGEGRTERFDRGMGWLYAGVVAALVVAGGWVLFGDRMGL